jgi:hypothetical protein
MIIYRRLLRIKSMMLSTTRASSWAVIGTILTERNRVGYVHIDGGGRLVGFFSNTITTRPLFYQFFTTLARAMRVVIDIESALFVGTTADKESIKAGDEVARHSSSSLI